METVEIRCPKSILNVAERAKKVKNAIYQALERVRDTVLFNSLVIRRTPTNLLTPPLYGDLKNKIHVVKQVLTTCYPTDTGDIEKSNILFRDVAQFGSALRSGRRGRRFKSCHPDQQNLSNQAVSEVFALSKKV